MISRSVPRVPLILGLFTGPRSDQDAMGQVGTSLDAFRSADLPGNAELLVRFQFAPPLQPRGRCRPTAEGMGGQRALQPIAHGFSQRRSPQLDHWITREVAHRMPKYLFQSRYTSEGARGLMKEGGTSRRAATERALASVGGRLESFYYAFGGTDVFIVADLPDNAVRRVAQSRRQRHGDDAQRDHRVAHARGTRRRGSETARLPSSGQRLARTSSIGVLPRPGGPSGTGRP